MNLLALTRPQADAARLREALARIVREITDEDDNERNALGSCLEVVKIAREALGQESGAGFAHHSHTRASEGSKMALV